jgi:hypothetical protein
MESELIRCACCRIWKMARSVHILRHILQNDLAARRSLHRNIGPRMNFRCSIMLHV